MLKLTLLSRLRPRSGYDVVAVIAMCAALGTGGAYAAGTIGSEEVVDESLTDADIKNGSLGPAIADQSIGPWELKPAGVWGSHILDESVTGSDVAESTLDKVPAAAAADTAQTAQKATTAGSAPIAGYNIVSAALPWNDEPLRVGNVTCPAGQKVLGGTYWMSHPDYPWTWIPADVMTKIINNGTSFRVAVADDYLRDKQLLINNQPWGAGPWNFDIQATCAKVGWPRLAEAGRPSAPPASRLRPRWRDHARRSHKRSGPRRGCSYRLRKRRTGPTKTPTPRLSRGFTAVPVAGAANPRCSSASSEQSPGRVGFLPRGATDDRTPGRTAATFDVILAITSVSPANGVPRTHAMRARAGP